MIAEKNKYYVSSHAERVSAYPETTDQPASRHGYVHNQFKSLNENARKFISEMEQTINEIKTDYYKKKTKEL